ncbi:hypothetical protein, partial [Methanolobus sp.]|uniref:hypothetical protein n=1 Tax=Methanolobus sp. TaxID=1874737 RepID=UPI0025E1AD25
GISKSSEDFESHLYENQLSREYINLHQINKIDNLIVDGNTENFLIYLTADYSLPTEDFDKALNELKTHDDISNIRKHLLWVSWYDLYNNLFTEHSGSVLQPFEVHILDDLKNYLKKKRFWSFRGFGPFDSNLKENKFRFYQSEEQISFNWNFQENALLKPFYNEG